MQEVLQTCCVPRGSPCCLLSLEALQDRQMSPFRSLPLCWDSVCKNLHVPFKHQISVSYSSLALLNKNPAGHQSHSGVSFSLCKTLVPGSPVWAQTPHSLGKTSTIVILLLFWVVNLGLWILTIPCFHSSYLYHYVSI